MTTAPWEATADGDPGIPGLEDPTAFSLAVESSERGSARIVLGGELDLLHTDWLECELERLQSRYPEVLLDLASASFVDSTGLFAMVRAHKRAQRNGGVFVIAACPHSVARLFHMTGLDRYLRLIDEGGTGDGHGS